VFDGRCEPDDVIPQRLDRTFGAVVADWRRVMVKSRRSPVPLAVLLCVISISPVAAGKKDFDARWKEAEQNVRAGAGQQYFNDVFFKEFFGKYAVHMTECAQRTGERMKADLNAAVELGARGQVLAVMVRPNSKVSRCFADLVKRDIFSPPPSGHFWIPVTVTSTER
jgi:hypothetical protein